MAIAISPAQYVVSEPVPSNPGPGLLKWIESYVDNRVDTRVGLAIRQLKDGDLANVVAVARREGASASTALAIQAEKSREKLEGEMAGLADAQVRLLNVIEGLSSDTERNATRNSRERASALATVEQVMSTVGELQRSFEQDGDSVALRFQEHEAALGEMRRLHAEETSRHKTALVELQGLHSESAARQRKYGEELASAYNAIASTRQEVSDLSQLVQRLEKKLATWRTEATAEVAEEIRAAAAARAAEAEDERTTAAAARTELEARLKESLQAVALRSESWHEENFRIGKELEVARREVDVLAEANQRLEQKLSSWHAEATKEIRSVSSETRKLAGAREAENERFQELQREVSAGNALRAEFETRLERFQADSATESTRRNAFEFRIQELCEDVRKQVQEAHEDLRKQVQEAHDELCKQVETWELAFRQNLPESLVPLRSEISAESAEMRAMLKCEQNAVAALDEQLWLTDQRLGQRIDELAHAQERTTSLIAEWRQSGMLTPRAAGLALESAMEPRAITSARRKVEPEEQLEVRESEEDQDPTSRRNAAARRRSLLNANLPNGVAARGPSEDAPPGVSLPARHRRHSPDSAKRSSATDEAEAVVKAAPNSREARIARFLGSPYS
eukprot:gnl/TRDRNA2_/TRDRNA2_128949_c0_seq1.p1 gnl/TRDRNA2_/TRDRNA2_128949_c0~~gnl/TRDRNA2_/TRDRNA2_128949_c0_seq1.p1  ORF type:complete len:626 (+),score=142.18 gnl/TRDRNA2_/TRDRNA2_128949_c0_seq1:63-1940(+)